MVSAVLIGVLAVLGVIVGILLLLAGGYLWWRHKRSQLKFIEPNEFDEESPNAGIDPALLNLITSSQSNFSNSQNQFGGGGGGGAGAAAGASGANSGPAGSNQKGDSASSTGVSAVTAFAATNNLNKKLNGFLNLKTPLIGGG